MKSQYLKIYTDNPEERKINTVVQALKKGAIIIYPTDTIYGIGCTLLNKKSLSKLVQILGLRVKKFNLSFICSDISQVSAYTKPFSNEVFRIMKKSTPGPYTFILSANNKVPKLLNTRKNTVGIRIPNSQIIARITKSLGSPIITASIKDEDEIIEYSTDPTLIYNRYSTKVDVFIDGGYGKNIASTILDCTGSVVKVLREGAGKLPNLL